MEEGAPDQVKEVPHLCYTFSASKKMPATNPRVSAVIDRKLAEWLQRRSEREGRSVSVLVREILAKQCAEEEERYWAGEGERRLETFDREGAVRHEEAWD